METPTFRRSSAWHRRSSTTSPSVRAPRVGDDRRHAGGTGGSLHPGVERGDPEREERPPVTLQLVKNGAVPYRGSRSCSLYTRTASRIRRRPSTSLLPGSRPTPASSRTATRRTRRLRAVLRAGRSRPLHAGLRVADARLHRQHEGGEGTGRRGWTCSIRSTETSTGTGRTRTGRRQVLALLNSGAVQTPRRSGRTRASPC